jgi:Holliday junction resolvase RusA-like endonuclease
MGCAVTFQVLFNIYGDPVPKKRPRFTKTGRTYTPKETMTYEAEVAKMAKTAMGSTDPLETPVAVYIYVALPIPPSYSKKRSEACLTGFEKPCKKPDLDNLVKSVLDGMNGIVYQDDCQIVSLHATKRYDSVASVNVLVREELE